MEKRIITGHIVFIFTNKSIIFPIRKSRRSEPLKTPELGEVRFASWQVLHFGVFDDQAQLQHVWIDQP